MAPNPASSFMRKSPSLFNLIFRSPKPRLPFGSPTSRIYATPIRIRGFGSLSYSCRSYTTSLNSSHGGNSNYMGRSKIDLKPMGFQDFRVSAISNGSTGGTGGGVGVGVGVGGSGGGNSGGGGDESGGGGGSNWSLLSWYLAALEKYPVLTKALTSALLTFFGDMICQLVIDEASTLDVKRTFIFTLLGFVLVGPMLHFWYLYLSKLVTVPGVPGTVMRLVLDQLLFSPIFIGFFLSALVTLEGRPSEVIPKLQQEWLSVVVANWQLWVPFQFLNFRFVPQQFQVLAANVISLAWNVILSFKAHKEILPK